MCNYKLTVIIGKNSDIVDGGGWVTSMTWRKSTILEAKDRAQVLALRDLLNSSKPAVDEDGYLMWNRCYGMCNTQCWQWELACAHSTCINQIMRRADVDWADARHRHAHHHHQPLHQLKQTTMSNEQQDPSVHAVQQAFDGHIWITLGRAGPHTARITSANR